MSVHPSELSTAALPSRQDVELEAEGRLRARYATRNGRLHRLMLDRMLSLSVANSRPRNPAEASGIPLTVIAERTHRNMVEDFGHAPTPDGYILDIVNLLSVKRLRTAVNVHLALQSGLFVPSIHTIPLLHDIANDLPEWRYSRFHDNVLTYGYQLANDDRIRENEPLLHAYLNTDPPLGWDQYLIYAAARHGTTWDTPLIARLLDRYDRVVATDPDMTVHPGTGVPVDGYDMLIDMSLAALLTQPHAPTERVAVALPNLIAFYEHMVTSPMHDDPQVRSDLARLLDPAHPLRKHLPDSLISSLVIMFATT